MPLLKCLTEGNTRIRRQEDDEYAEGITYSDLF